jgi:hypothetical protein
MATIQEIFDRIQKTKQEVRELKNLYKAELTSLQEYEELKEKIQGHKMRKIQIEKAVQEKLQAEFIKYDALKQAMADDQQILSDLSLSTYLKGEKVEVVDATNTLHVPFFKVLFKKTRS